MYNKTERLRLETQTESGPNLYDSGGWPCPW